MVDSRITVRDLRLVAVVAHKEPRLACHLRALEGETSCDLSAWPNLRVNPHWRQPEVTRGHKVAHAPLSQVQASSCPEPIDGLAVADLCLRFPLGA